MLGFRDFLFLLSGVGEMNGIKQYLHWHLANGVAHLDFFTGSLDCLGSAYICTGMGCLQETNGIFNFLRVLVIGTCSLRLVSVQRCGRSDGGRSAIS